ncbi:hypothetical protein J4H86_22355 [Spiractinospora alimapuensis]|uniref:helix-turn-helix transcriptional regulator n=1 Tax=Spiractinospora alimapuensis TaxID=2820884 RepID=UPI001F2F19D5|nr:hypothetical protein [Spiractinospora alimapuensis]QVQ51508.1 hypothetical protein J4H86_22355 [Spiractinospora alimapuensis]
MTMSEYEFIFVLSGISLEDDEAVNTLTTELDALLSSQRGMLRMTVTGEGSNAVSAAIATAQKAHELVDDVRFVRLDRDLVGVSDIADRIGRSRQNVDQWVRGQRCPSGPFPEPEAMVGASPVWLWADINAWLRPLGLDDGERRPTREQMNRIDLVLPSVRLVPTHFGGGRTDGGAEVSAFNVEARLVRSASRTRSAAARALHRHLLARAGEATDDEAFLRL